MAARVVAQLFTREVAVKEIIEFKFSYCRQMRARVSTGFYDVSL